MAIITQVVFMSPPLSIDIKYTNGRILAWTILGVATKNVY